MPRIGWTTDPHLNFVSEPGRLHFYETLREAELDLLLVGGDLGEAESVAGYLAELDRHVRIPTYFVMGNHDFYRGSIADLRERIGRLAASLEKLTYLTRTAEPVALTAEWGLVGHDNWADGRLGAGALSKVMLNDFLLISELRTLDAEERFRRLAVLGDGAAAELEPVLRRALARFPNVLCLLHVPPFAEACWHEGRISDAEYLPHFASLAMGEMLRRVMTQHSGRQLTVLCGHTHSGGLTRILPNLTVKTGGSVYGSPRVESVWEV
ncbi:MAG: metallophosphoesterase [Bryobacteraceae bacterium]